MAEAIVWSEQHICRQKTWFSQFHGQDWSQGLLHAGLLRLDKWIWHVPVNNFPPLFHLYDLSTGTFSLHSLL